MSDTISYDGERFIVNGVEYVPITRLAQAETLLRRAEGLLTWAHDGSADIRLRDSIERWFKDRFTTAPSPVAAPCPDGIRGCNCANWSPASPPSPPVARPPLAMCERWARLSGGTPVACGAVAITGADGPCIKPAGHDPGDWHEDATGYTWCEKWRAQQSAPRQPAASPPVCEPPGEPEQILLSGGSTKGEPNG